MSDLAQWLLIVDVTVNPSIEAAWNRWYNEVHVPAIACCPGFKSASRYVSDTGGGRRYQSIYELEGPEAVLTDEFAHARGWFHFSADVQATVRVHRKIFPDPTELPA